MRKEPSADCVKFDKRIRFSLRLPASSPDLRFSMSLSNSLQLSMSETMRRSFDKFISAVRACSATSFKSPTRFAKDFTRSLLSTDIRVARPPSVPANPATFPAA